MFVKIRYMKKEKNGCVVENARIIKESLYTCYSVSIIYEDSLGGVSLLLKNENQEGSIINIEFVGEVNSVDVFFMNNDGKTIDRYAF